MNNFFEIDPETEIPWDSNFCCYKCVEGKTVQGISASSTKMILCPICGNKRCPKATDHNLECTNSNESGQKGSIYE